MIPSDNEARPKGGTMFKSPKNAKLLILSLLVCVSASCSHQSSNGIEARKIASETEPKGNDTGNKIEDKNLKNLSRKELKKRWGVFSSVSDEGNFLTQVSLVEEVNKNGLAAMLADSQTIYRIGIQKRSVDKKLIDMDVYQCEPNKKALKDAGSIESQVGGSVAASFICEEIKFVSMTKSEIVPNSQMYFSMFQDESGTPLFVQHYKGFMRQFGEKYTYFENGFGSHHPDLDKFFQAGE